MHQLVLRAQVGSLGIERCRRGAQVRVTVSTGMLSTAGKQQAIPRPLRHLAGLPADHGTREQRAGWLGTGVASSGSSCWQPPPEQRCTAAHLL